MNAWNLKLPVIFAVLCISAFAIAGDCDFSQCSVPAKNCDPSMCPPGCCTVAEYLRPCGEGIGWEKLHWQGVRYDEKGHVLKEMTERQAMNIARQYLEKYHYEASLKLAVGDKDSYKFEVISSIFKGKMLEINRKNGWARQYDGC